MERMKNKTVYDVFIERGFIEKVTDEGKIPEILEGKVTSYIGSDPTASSFHVGNLVPIMSLAYMQRHGHQPIALVVELEQDWWEIPVVRMRCGRF